MSVLKGEKMEKGTKCRVISDDYGFLNREKSLLH
nr:MAG TPA: hypothetical protein [Caudoviricetes sp.]